MDHIYKYSILTAIPDARRGERVNVGIAIYLPDRIDVRLPGANKIGALMSGAWDEYLLDAQRRLTHIYGETRDEVECATIFGVTESVVQLSEVSWFSISNVAEYDARVEEILNALVVRPASKKKATIQRINTEISRALKQFKVLAEPEEGIEDHKVVRDFYVSREEELRADFALKNGVYHITATLDLRKSDVLRAKGDAAIKALVLDKAQKKFGDDAKRIGVFAGADPGGIFKPHIEILKDYSNNVYNWSDESDRRAYMKLIVDALHGPQRFGLRPPNLN